MSDPTISVLLIILFVLHEYRLHRLEARVSRLTPKPPEVKVEQPLLRDPYAVWNADGTAIFEASHWDVSPQDFDRVLEIKIRSTAPEHSGPPIPTPTLITKDGAVAYFPAQDEKALLAARDIAAMMESDPDALYVVKYRTRGQGAVAIQELVEIREIVS